MAEGLTFSRFDHIGVLVRDMDRALAYYNSLGFGPLSLAQNVAVKDTSLKMSITRLGPVYIELIQPEGNSLWKELLESGGEGINHIAFIVDDIGKEMARLEEKKVKVLFSRRYPNGGGAAYFDTRKIGDVIFELIQWPEGGRSKAPPPWSGIL